ncbi:MAG: GGDEF domain-containing protein [Clostridiales bacterium]|nr:GGDEF domain-containing protein [Clostridiales bacterium]
MNLLLNAEMCVFSVTALLAIWISLRKADDRKSLNFHLFSMLLCLTVFLLITDLLTRVEGCAGTIYYLINAIGNYLLFFFGPLLPILWLLYVHNQIFSDDRETIGILRLLLIPFGINAVLLIGTQLFGWYYFIDSDNIYRRGSLFFIPVVLDLAIFFSVYLLLIINRKRIERKYFRYLMFFGVPPLICVILQTLLYGTAFILNGIALSIIIINIYTQNTRMNIDYLTGAFNRKQLDRYLADKIRKSAGDKTFSVIMLDMDGFKRINDSFGHAAGDDALKTLVGLLKKSTRQGDFIARYGGDEFYIVMDISDMAALRVVVDRIHDCVRTFNESGEKPYRLSLSMGYMLYDTEEKPDADAYKAQVDKQMYLSKTGQAKQGGG